MRARLVVAALALASVVPAGCQEASSRAEAGRPLVVASFYPLYDFASRVTEGRAEIVSLVPTGVQPHDWEPSPQDIARVERAVVFIYNGAGFDPAAERLAKSAVGDRTVVVEAARGLALLSVDLPGHDKKEDHDPHVWLDPTLAVAQVEAIRAALARADPTNAAHYTSNARAYSARLSALHAAFAAGLAQCVRREIVVSHAAFAYLAHRYDLLQVPVMGLAPQAEPSAAELARIVRLVRRLKANVIFFETLVSPRLAETLAGEVGATTLVLNPLEGLTSTEARAGQDYVRVMKHNLENLRRALDCR